jgi:hypothetical protein
MAAAPAAAEPAASATGLPAWLAGGWASQEADGKWSEEWWTTARAGVMFGAGRSGSGARLDGWEQTRIEFVDGRLRFCARPKGEEGACFVATRITASEVVFENPSHDFPTRIAYRKEGADLVAEISGAGGSHPQRWRFKRMN